MLILQLYSGQNTKTGDYVYRIDRPAKGLSSLPNVEVVNLDLLNASAKEVLLEAPLLILHHLSDPDLLPVVRERKARDLPTIYELSDHFRFSQAHKAPHGNFRPDTSTIIEEIIRRCDAVQTTGPALQERYSDLNQNFFIFPNLVGEIRSRRPKPDRAPLTIGWGGSSRHLTDLKHYALPLIKWLVKHPEVRLAIMGSKSIRRLFDQVPARQLMLRNPGGLQEYLSFLEEIDIGIAPLLPTEFNACRSDVKFLEYASLGVVPVCSRFGPYLSVGREGESILLFNDAKELTQHLEKLYIDENLRTDIAKKAQSWVADHRLDRTDQWEIRATAYRQILQRNPLNSEAAPDFGDNCIKSDVADVIARAMRRDDPAAILEKEVAQFPDDYQLHYFYGWGLSKAGKYDRAVAPLKRAVAIRPDSIRTLELLTRIFILSRDFGAALQTVERALEIEPELQNLLQLKRTVRRLRQAKISN